MQQGQSLGLEGCLTFLLRGLGGWVGGWAGDRKMEENEAVRRRCCTSHVGGWVGGWVGGRTHRRMEVGREEVGGPAAAATSSGVGKEAENRPEVRLVVGALGKRREATPDLLRRWVGWVERGERGGWNALL